MPAITRRRLIIALLLAVILLIGSVSLSFRRPDLKARSAEIVVGSSRETVEQQFGPPYLDMQRTRGGGLFVWVDQLWQLDVLFDPEGRVESVKVMPVDSFFRRTVGRGAGVPDSARSRDAVISEGG